MPLHVSSICAYRQEVKIVLYSLWYHHTETSEWSKITKITNITKIQLYKYEHIVVKFTCEFFGCDYCVLLTINMLWHVEVMFNHLLNLLERYYVYLHLCKTLWVEQTWSHSGLTFLPSCWPVSRWELGSDELTDF